MKCNLSHKAEQDVLNIAKYFKKQNGNLVKEFYGELNETRKTLARFPDIGSFASSNFKVSHKRLEQTRFWLMSKFSNYIIFYQKREKDLVILRVVHVKQDIQVLFK